MRCLHETPSSLPKSPFPRPFPQGRTLRRLDGRLCKKKAAVAIAHKILVIVYHLLTEGTVSDEQRYAHLQPKQEDHWRRSAVKTLERLGY